MTRVTRVVLALAALATLASVSATAQQARAALRAGHEAYELADFAAAIQPLSRGLDPQGGPRDSLWVLGLHRLTEALQFEGRGDEAQVWLRWAFRLESDLPIDSINFVPEVVNAFRAARQHVRDTPTVNGRAMRSWVWSGAASTATGTLEIAGGDYVVNALVANRTLLRSGAGTTLPAGSYRVDFSADGYLAGNCYVAVLPGVSTVLDLELEPAFPAMLYVGSQPWARVIIDGDSVGYTTLAAHRLPPGTHTLRLWRSGYLPFDTTVTVASGDTTRVGPIPLQSRVREREP
ncbi:MAG: PEGA domain-containing protein [Gemmatimonadales bacterium]|jgi:hypothetical protein